MTYIYVLPTLDLLQKVFIHTAAVAAARNVVCPARNKRHQTLRQQSRTTSLSKGLLIEDSLETHQPTHGDGTGDTRNPPSSPTPNRDGERQSSGFGKTDKKDREQQKKREHARTRR